MNKQLYNIKKIAGMSKKAEITTAQVFPGTTGFAVGSGVGAGIGGLTRLIYNLVQKKKLTDQLLSSVLLGAGIGGTAGYVGGRGYAMGHSHGVQDSIDIIKEAPAANIFKLFG